VTTIRFTLPVSTSVSLTVYDVTGRVVQRLVANTMGAGTYEVQWNGRNLAGAPVASGVYLSRLQTDHQVMSHRMVLLK
jgi:flagellar hook assembly protein FlgD